MRHMTLYMHACACAHLVLCHHACHNRHAPQQHTSAPVKLAYDAIQQHLVVPMEAEIGRHTTERVTLQGRQRVDL